MTDSMSLTGKHILITGGSSGIGRQCAIRADQLGARVTLVARGEDGLRETLSMLGNREKHAYYALDLIQTDAIEPLVERIVSERGAVDGLCHAAGIGTVRMLKQTKPAFVEKMLRVHLYAFIELVRCLSAKGNMNDGASLVGVSSVAAEAGNASQGAYAAAKAGMNGFVGPAAQELAGRGIRINTVAFAAVDTRSHQEFLCSINDKNVLERQRLGTIDVQSAANAVMFLLSDACRYITGTVLPVYAGY